MTIRYKEGANERAKRVTNITLAIIVIAGFFSLESIPGIKTKEQYILAGVLAYMAAVSDGTVRVILAMICGILLWKTLA